MPAPRRNCCNDSIAKEGCRWSVLGVGKDEKSIVGIEVGICALHGGERGPPSVCEWFAEPSAKCASLHGTGSVLLALGQGVMCIVAAG